MQWRRALFPGSHDLTWRIAWAFMIGSTLFALGSFPPFAHWVNPGIVGITFFVGSVFFTSAAFGQVVQVVQVVDDVPGGVTRPRRSWFRARSRDWWSAVIQLTGTILFNINTIDAMIEGLTTQETNRLVWAPDMFGSAAFLIASHLAWLSVCGRIWCIQRDREAWWSAAVNYVGSIFFGVSAIASLTLPTTGETLNTALVNSATFAGATCFLLGAYLLLPVPTPRPSGSVR